MFHRRKILSQHLHGTLRTVKDRPVRIADHSAKGWTNHLSNTRQKSYCCTNTFSKNDVHCTSLTISMKRTKANISGTQRYSLQFWPPAGDCGVFTYKTDHGLSWAFTFVLTWRTRGPLTFWYLRNFTVLSQQNSKSYGILDGGKYRNISIITALQAEPNNRGK
jgi:hypothetical protein